MCCGIGHSRSSSGSTAGGAAGFRPFITAAVASALLNDRTRVDDPEAVEIVTSALRSTQRRGFDLAIRCFVLGRPDLGRAARSLTVPTLFAAGDDRGEWTPADAQAVVSTMRHATAATLPGVRGFAPLEDPEAVIGLLREFWATTTTG